MTSVFTVQIGVAGRIGLIEDRRYLDVTVKSGDGVFAPTWEMVMGSKEGRMSQKEYTDCYYVMMRDSYRWNRARWNEVLGMDEVILACYCRGGWFCHRHLLKDMLVRCGAAYAGEIKDSRDMIGHH